MVNLLVDGPDDAAVTFILAHGAGAGMDTPFMNEYARGLAAAGGRVIRFEFDYMVIRRETGSRRPPDRQPKLLEHFRRIIENNRCQRLVIGGKSMGGRMASILASGIEGDDPGRFHGLLCLGYPFHPPAKPDKLRLDHFSSLQTPALICQGARDPFGPKEEVAGFNLPSCVKMHWLADGDHSFKPRKKSGITLETNMESAIGAAIDRFL